MNRLLKITGLLLLLAPGFLVAKNSCNSNNGCSGKTELTDFSGHTFFSIRPQFQSQSPEKVAFFRNDRMYMDCDGWGGAFQLAFFGGESRRGRDLAKWFFPFGKTELLVVEGDEVAAGGFIVRDVDASQFNIETVDQNFQSRISICPEQTVFGIGLDWKQMITCKDDGTMGFWGEISFPITRVRNRVNLVENVINDGGGVDPDVMGAQPNMIAAFRQPGFLFGRIDDRNEDALEEWGVADVEIKAGYNFSETECSHVYAFVGVIAPTGTRPTGVRVFEPIVGHNDHFGVMIGGNYGYECWETECGVWRVEADFASKYFTSNCETRSIDVIDKQWSRYMRVYRNATDAANADPSNGINVFTLKMDIEPRFTMNYNTAIIYEHDCGFSVELGYNFYARQAEKIKSVVFPDQPQFVDVNPDNINPARTIAHQYQLLEPLNATTEYIPITAADLNYNSAAHPAVLTQSYYGGVNYDWDICGWPIFTNVVGIYEHSANNAGLNRWTVAGKLGFAF